MHLLKPLPGVYIAVDSYDPGAESCAECRARIALSNRFCASCGAQINRRNSRQNDATACSGTRFPSHNA